MLIFILHALFTQTRFYGFTIFLLLPVPKNQTTISLDYRLPTCTQTLDLKSNKQDK